MGRTNEMEYEWWLASVRPLSDKKKRLLRETYGNGKEIYKRLYNIEEKQFHKLHGLTEKEIQILRKSARTVEIGRAYEEAIAREIRFVPYFVKEYPGRLRKYQGMPYALYVKGKLPEENQPTAAIVGARKCTPYGEGMAIEFAEKLALAGVQIISGMASGIDGAAQRAAIAAGGTSFGVLGCGIDVCYPRENKGLYTDLQQHGGILSEQTVGTPPLREYFPARNRIISGLADVVLVMEAGERSGSLITADLALEQGKDIYALPGPVTSLISRGCHELIRQGAGILISPEILLEDMEIDSDFINDFRSENKKMLESNENLVYASIGLYPKSLSGLLAETRLPAAELMRTLVSLEIKGYIRELSKNYYVRT